MYWCHQRKFLQLIVKPSPLSNSLCCLPYISYKYHSENYALHQIISSNWLFFFLPSHCLNWKFIDIASNSTVSHNQSNWFPIFFFISPFKKRGPGDEIDMYLMQADYSRITCATVLNNWNPCQQYLTFRHIASHFAANHSAITRSCFAWDCSWWSAISFCRIWSDCIKT